MEPANFDQISYWNDHIEQLSPVVAQKFPESLKQQLIQVILGKKEALRPALDQRRITYEDTQSYLQGLYEMDPDDDSTDSEGNDAGDRVEKAQAISGDAYYDYLQLKKQNDKLSKLHQYLLNTEEGVLEYLIHNPQDLTSDDRAAMSMEFRTRLIQRLEGRKAQFLDEKALAQVDHALNQLPQSKLQ